MKWRSLALVCFVLVAACGGRAQPPAPQVRTLQPRSITLPRPVDGSPAFRMSFDRLPHKQTLRRLKKLRGVADAVPLRTRTMVVHSGGRSLKLRVGSAPPLRFRTVAPAPTKAADFVWTSLIQGRVVITPEAAARLRVSGPVTLKIGSASLQVGAFADNAVPNVVDLLISDNIASKLHLGDARVMVVGAKNKTKLDGLRDSIKRLVPKAKIKDFQKRTTPAVAPEPIGQAQGSLIGTMRYRIKKNGFIEPDPAWIAANIVTARVPILGTIMCHRLLVPQLAAALNEVAQEDLGHLIHPGEYGGCYVPRFIGRDTHRALSMHAFGLALDLNVKENYQGTRGNMDPRIVEIFERWGFRWGGYWSQPDPMHFELARLIQP